MSTTTRSSPCLDLHTGLAQRHSKCSHWQIPKHHFDILTGLSSYYINPPGVSSSEGCVWGDDSKPIGNWSPYVAGSNTDGSGQTFVKIAWNPIWTASALCGEEPSYGVKIECEDGGCNGLPCSINPAEDGIGGLTSPVSTSGVGGAEFCVVTVPKGKTAKIVVFNTDGSKGKPSSSAEPSYPATSTSESSESSSYSSSSSSSSPESSSSSFPTVMPGMFHENATSSSDSSETSSHSPTKPPTSSATGLPSAVPTTSKNEGVAEKGGAAVASLIIALVAAAALY